MRSAKDSGRENTNAADKSSAGVSRTPRVLSNPAERSSENISQHPPLTRAAIKVINR